MQQALAHQRSDRLAQARTLYQQALELDPDNFDILHMLGVIDLRWGDPEAGAGKILRALKVSGNIYPPALTNLGLGLAAISRKRGLRVGLDSPEETDFCHPAFLRRADLPALPPDPPGITVVLPVRDQARRVGEALQSVYGQTYRNIELIVIDDGSGDDSATAARQALSASPFPHRLIAREGRGTPATLNQGVELARHEWVTILHADDRYAPQRLEWMLRALIGGPAAWGYSGVALLDASSAPVPPGADPRADGLYAGLENRYRLSSFAAGFGRFNHAVSAGNLVFRKSLWQEIGGFSAHRHVHDWNFCMQALLHSELVFIDEPLYQYRLAEGETAETSAQAGAEAEALIGAWLGRLSDSRPIANPTLERDRTKVMGHDWTLMSEGKGHLVGLSRLTRYANAFGLD